MNFNTFKHFFLLGGLIALLAITGGCKLRIGKGSFGYNLKGAHVSPECKTASVEYFKNQAPLVQPLLAQKLTEKLKDKLLAQTSLKLTNGNGDINFSGTIEGYETQPMAPQSGDNVTGALNRLTVSIQVKYSNSKESQYEYDTRFSRYKDYDSNINLDQFENSKEFEDLINELVQDIFDKAFVNW